MIKIDAHKQKIPTPLGVGMEGYCLSHYLLFSKITTC